MSNRAFGIAAGLTALSATMGACGGGGGGGAPQTGVTTPPPVTTPTPIPTPATNFASWSDALRPNASITIAGKTAAMRFTFTSAGATSARTPAPVTDTVFTQGMGSQTNIESVAISGDPGPGAMTTARDIFIATTTDLVATSRDGARTLQVVDPASRGLNYQSYGIWSAEYPDTASPAGGASVLGAVTYGSATAGSALPTTGGARFNGDTLLRVVWGKDGSLSGSRMTAPATVDVDFAGRSASLSARVADLEGAASPFNAAPRYTQITGALTWTPGQNQLAGSFTATPEGGGAAIMSGSGAATFYGPAAQEIGGTFSLIATDPTSQMRVIGAFGAKR